MKPPITLATRQVVAFDETGIDRLTDRDAAKRACTAASEPKMIFVVTSTTRPPFLRLTTWASCSQQGEGAWVWAWVHVSRDVQDDLWYAIHMQQGMSIVRQLIAGKERNIPATDRLQALEQHR